MSEKQKSETELKQELLATQKRIESMLAEAKSYKRKPANKPAIIFLMTCIFAVIGWDLYRSRHPWAKLGTFLPGVALFVAFGVYWFIGNRKAKREAKNEAAWNQELEAVVDIKDFDDSYCLYKNLDSKQREKLLHEVRRMPRGSRSLLKTVRLVSPDLIDE